MVMFNDGLNSIRRNVAMDVDVTMGSENAHALLPWLVMDAFYHP
jgi:hypothetical protein